MSRVLPLGSAAAGLMLLGVGLVPRHADADAPLPPPDVREVVRYVQQGEYTVERTIWIDARVVADPEALADEVAGIEPGAGDGMATAQYKLNSHKWNASTIPVPVYYNPAGQGTNPNAGPVIESAISKWSAVTPTKFTFTWMGTTTRGTGACDDNIDADGFNTVAYSSGLPFGVLGTTCTLFKGSNAPLEEFDMVLDAGTPWSVANPTPNGKYDLHSTMLHELGHAAGIGHPCSVASKTSNSCNAAEKLAVMFAFLDDGEQRRTLTADDEAALRAQYPGGAIPTPSPSPSPSPSPTVGTGSGDPTRYPVRAMLPQLANDELRAANPTPTIPPTAGATATRTATPSPVAQPTATPTTGSGGG